MIEELVQFHCRLVLSQLHISKDFLKHCAVRGKKGINKLIKKLNILYSNKAKLKSEKFQETYLNVFARSLGTGPLKLLNDKSLKIETELKYLQNRIL